MGTQPLFTGSILLITIVANIFLVIVVLRSNFKTRINQLLILHNISLAVWAFFILLNMWLPWLTGRWEYYPGDWGYFFEKIIMFSGALIFFASYWFVQYFIYERIRRTPLNYLMLVFEVLVLVICFFDNTIFSQVKVTRQGYSLVDKLPAGLIYTLYLFLHILFTLGVLFRAIPREKDRYKKSQIKVLSLVFAIMFVLGVLANWVLPTYFNMPFFNALGPTISLVMVGGIIYSIKQHNFLDIKHIIQRGLVYSLLFSIVAAFYLFLVFILGYIFKGSTDATVLAAAGASTLFGIFGVPYLEKMFKRATDKFFFKGRYVYSEAVYGISEILNNNIELDRLLKGTAVKLREVFRVVLATVTVPDSGLTYDSEGRIRQARDNIGSKTIRAIRRSGRTVVSAREIPDIMEEFSRQKADIGHINALRAGQGYMAKYGFEVLVLIVSRGKLVGFVLLSKKLSGDLFNKEDLNLLKTFAVQAAVAIEKALFYQQVIEYSRDLEKKVEQRTASVKKLQENQKQTMQELAHGLQTPLTILKVNLEQLRRECRDGRKLDLIEKSIDRISRFIYDLLRLSKLEAGGQNIKMEIFDLSQALKDQLESLQIIARDKNIKISGEIASGLAIKGNPAAIEELVNNLVSNSMKYMKKRGDKRIALRLGREGRQAALTVEDNGIGVAAKDRPRLFSRFYRVEDRAVDNEQGSGLGLAICKKIVEAHQGQIKVKSQKGRGTLIKIKLDLKEVK